MSPEIGSLPPAMPPRQFTFVVLLCGFLALSMNVVALVSPSWVTSKHFSLSLWEICSQQSNAWHCRSALSTDWQVASLILVLCATLLSGLWFIASVLWICQVKQPLKFRNLSFLLIISVLLQISALLLFSLLLAAQLLPRSSQFSWGYGLGWGSCIFMLGTVVISCLRTGLSMD